MRPRLRLLTCGSVDDGKSTLIGRLLHDAGLILDDHLDVLADASRKHGTTGDELDFALLLDGLDAEREQGITIDVAYRHFATARRAFIVADTPGHEQYTRNMATGASNCELAVILVDARKGLLTQTLRHATIVSLLGIRHVVLAVNKMDLVEFRQPVFDAIVQGFRKFAAALSFNSIMAIPVSARHGDNVTSASRNMPWYGGPALLAFLEEVDVEASNPGPFRMPVQWINRPHLDFRGYSGTIAGGEIRSGDTVLVAGSSRTARVARIVTAAGDLDKAQSGDAVTLVLDRELDIARGDVLADPTHPPQVADQITAHLIWMDEASLFPGRPYLMKAGTQQTTATVTALKYQLDVDTLSHHAAKTLSLNQVGLCNLSTAMPIVFDPYAENRNTGCVHPGRPLFGRDRRGRHDLVRAAPRIDHSAAGDRRDDGGARRAEAPAAGDPLVHRPLGRRQIDHREPPGSEAARARRAHHDARRRQCPARPQPRPRLHRGRPGREHPPRRRSGQADDRSRA